MNGFNCDISKISRISRFIMALDVCHCDVWQTFRISKFNGIQEFLCVWIFIILFSTKLNYREINALYNRYILSCCVNLKQQLEGELSYNNVKLRKREMDEGFFPSPFFRATTHVEEPRSTGLEETGSFYRDMKSWLSSKPEKRRRSLDGRGERIDRIISGEV